MSEILKDKAFKVTIGTAIVSAIFMFGIVWNVATAKATGDAKDTEQDGKITLNTSAITSMSQDLRAARDSLIKIEAVLGISEIETSRSSFKN